jgi:hypothetical protein
LLAIWTGFLDLQQDFDALHGRGDYSHGNCGEGAGGANLGDAELAVWGEGGEAADEVLA